MKLPNHEQAVVPEAKITLYLLSETHSKGRYKAVFFTHFGFSVVSWQLLANALHQHATENEGASMLTTEQGIQYAVEGVLQTPIVRTPNVRSVWAIDKDSDVPRLITAYPLDKQED